MYNNARGGFLFSARLLCIYMYTHACGRVSVSTRSLHSTVQSSLCANYRLKNNKRTTGLRYTSRSRIRNGKKGVYFRSCASEGFNSCECERGAHVCAYCRYTRTRAHISALSESLRYIHFRETGARED